MRGPGGEMSDLTTCARCGKTTPTQHIHTCTPPIMLLQAEAEVEQLRAQIATLTKERDEALRQAAPRGVTVEHFPRQPVYPPENVRFVPFATDTALLARIAEALERIAKSMEKP